MKKTILLIFFALASLSMLAQESLKGTWTISESVMGLTAAQALSFDSDSEGCVSMGAKVVMDVNMMGVKMTGEITLSARGNFGFDGSTLKIKWDRESMKNSYTKPVEVSYKGEAHPDMNATAKQMLDDAMKEVLKSIENESVFTDVSFKKGRMTLHGKDEKGNTVKETYTFVKK